jgi:hypothetical protein
MILRTLFIAVITISSLGAITLHENFETAKPGTVPKGWKVDATHPGNVQAKWSVTIAQDRPADDQKVLTLTQAGTNMFNLCYLPDTKVTDAAIEVKFHANSGKIDQGGGIAWRIKDANNYYVARFNPLEDNFRFYSVKDGYRSQLASANIHLDSGWHTMKIVHKGKHIEAYLDGKKLIESNDDTFTKSGAVGLWTKADAATSFDDLSLEGK